MIKKRSASPADYKLLFYFMLWLVFGLVMLTSASAAVGHERFKDSYFFIKSQILLGFLPGLLLFFLLSKFDYHKLKKISWTLYILSVCLLILVFVPGIGSNYGTHSKSWLTVIGYSFQPAELAKLGIVILLSYLISVCGQGLRELKKGFLLVVGAGLVPILLVVLQPDIGTVAILFAILLGLLLLGGACLRHIALLAFISLVALVAMVFVAPYRAARLSVFLHPELDPQGIGYHTNQAFLAIGSGGLLGRGLGHSLQKFQYLPEVAADSIYAVIAEETGFIFAVGFIILLVLVVNRGFVIVKSTSDEFGRLLAVGIIVWFAAQSFLNIGAMVGIVPLTGVPLPFVSHGGTALMVAMAGVGVLMSVSKYGKKQINSSL